MAIPTYPITCTGLSIIAPAVYELRFAKPEQFSFVPGQFVLFDVPHPDNAEDVQTRAYSIASTPDEGDLLFVIKLTPGGRASRWIEEKLRVGSKVVMKGPFGFFTVKAEDTKDLLLVGTGTGIAPLRSQALHLLSHGDGRRIDLLFCVRLEEDFFWKEELEKMAQEYQDFHVHFSLTSPEESWTGRRGRVQEVMPQIAHDLTLRSIYVCGNPLMTKDVKRLCLEEWGVQKQNLHVEGYI